MKYFFSFVLFGLFFTLTTSQAENLNRIEFFNRCEKIVKSKKYFLAYDRGEIKKFHLLKTTYSGDGKNNINLILDEIEKRNLQSDKRQVAYVLGTVFRETSSTMKPVHEAPGCKSEKCIHKNVGSYGQRKSNGKSYYGRGFSQLTHERNYKRFGSLLGMKPETMLYDNPDLALDPKIAAQIIVIGMYEGAFTDKYKLSDFFNENEDNWIGARKIVNPGSQRAPVTAGYAKLFFECITGQSLIQNGELIK